MKRNQTLLGVIALTLSAWTLSAQDAPPPERPAGLAPREGGERPANPPGERRDRLQSGRPNANLFQLLDANRDGAIDATELADGIKRLDKNGDGKIGPDEIRPPGERERRPQGDRPRDGEPPRESQRPRDGDRERTGRPDGDRPQGGPRDGDRPRDGGRPRDGARPKGPPPGGPDAGPRADRPGGLPQARRHHDPRQPQFAQPRPQPPRDGRRQAGPPAADRAMGFAARGPQRLQDSGARFGSQGPARRGVSGPPAHGPRPADRASASGHLPGEHFAPRDFRAPPPPHRPRDHHRPQSSEGPRHFQAPPGPRHDGPPHRPDETRRDSRPRPIVQDDGQVI